MYSVEDEVKISVINWNWDFIGLYRMLDNAEGDLRFLFHFELRVLLPCLRIRLKEE